MFRTRVGLTFWSAFALGFSSGCVNGLAAIFHHESTTRPNALNSYQIITGDDTDDEKEHWNAIYRSHPYVFGTDPSPSLRQHIAILPAGDALVIPMEEGRNAVFLAKNGYRVSGVDFSDVALRKAMHLAKEKQVAVTPINADLTYYSLKPESYDLIVNVDLFIPRMIQQIKQGLKKGGVVLYQARVVDSPRSTRDRDGVNHGELKELFKDFQILLYRESLEEGKLVANIIARKTS